MNRLGQAGCGVAYFDADVSGAGGVAEEQAHFRPLADLRAAIRVGDVNSVRQELEAAGKRRTDLVKQVYPGGETALMAAANGCLNDEKASAIIAVLLEDFPEEQLFDLFKQQWTQRYDATVLLFAAIYGLAGAVGKIFEKLDEAQALELLLLPLKRGDGAEGPKLLVQVLNDGGPQMVSVVRLIFEKIKGQDNRMELLTNPWIMNVTPVYMAAQEGSLDSVKIMLDGLDVDKRKKLLKLETQARMTPWDVAVKKNHTEIMAELSKGFEKEFDKNDALSKCILGCVIQADHSALDGLLARIIQEERVEILKSSLKNILAVGAHRLFGREPVLVKLFDGLTGGQRAELLGLSGGRGGTLLNRAISKNDCRTLALLLKGIDIAQQIEMLKKEVPKQRLLLLAAKLQNLPMIERLLAGCTAKERVQWLMHVDSEGATPLSYAVCSNDIPVLVQLLAGIDVVQRMEMLEKTEAQELELLAKAVRMQSLPMIKVFFDGLAGSQRVQLLAQITREKVTLLSLAATQGNPQMMAILLKGLNLDQQKYLLELKSSSDLTPLMVAAAPGRVPVRSAPKGVDDDVIVEQFIEIAIDDLLAPRAEFSPSFVRARPAPSVESLRPLFLKPSGSKTEQGVQASEEHRLPQQLLELAQQQRSMDEVRKKAAQL